MSVWTEKEKEPVLITEKTTGEDLFNMLVAGTPISVLSSHRPEEKKLMEPVPAEEKKLIEGKQALAGSVYMLTYDKDWDVSDVQDYLVSLLPKDESPYRNLACLTPHFNVGKYGRRVTTNQAFCVMSPRLANSTSTPELKVEQFVYDKSDEPKKNKFHTKLFMSLHDTSMAGLRVQIQKLNLFPELSTACVVTRCRYKPCALIQVDGDARLFRRALGCHFARKQNIV